MNPLVRPYQILLRNSVRPRGGALILFGNSELVLGTLCGFLHGEAYKRKRIDFKVEVK